MITIISSTMHLLSQQRLTQREGSLKITIIPLHSLRNFSSSCSNLTGTHSTASLRKDLVVVLTRVTLMIRKCLKTWFGWIRTESSSICLPISRIRSTNSRTLIPLAFKATILSPTLMIVRFWKMRIFIWNSWINISISSRTIKDSRILNLEIWALRMSRMISSSSYWRLKTSFRSSMIHWLLENSFRSRFIT